MIRPPPISTLFPYPTLSRSPSALVKEAPRRTIRAAGGRDAAERRAGDTRGHHSPRDEVPPGGFRDRKSTRLNSSHANISYAVFCLKKKKKSHRYDLHDELLC